MRRWTLLTPLTVVAISLAACSTTSSSPSTSAVATTPAVTAAPSTPASAAASQSTAPSASAAAIATVAPDQLILPGKLVVCSDLPYPPLEYFDDAGNPTGSDMDIAAGLASKLGLTVQIQNSVFDTIIAAVTGGKCDIVISDQNITPDRLKAVDMIPYFQAGQSFVVAKGNPKGIKTTDDLCGKSVAAETGTTEVHYINGTGDYKGDGLSKKCIDAGKAKIEAKEFQKDTEALAALLGSQVDAYFADTPVAANYTLQHPDQFELAAIPPLQPIKAGISVPKDKTGLHTAIVAALQSMMSDGSYAAILKKYNVEDGAVQPSDVK